MRIFLPGLLLGLLTLLCGCARVPDRSIQASQTSMSTNDKPTNEKDDAAMASERSTKSLKLGKIEVSRAGNITGQIENSSKEPLRVWKDSNSWGAACWRVLLLRKGRLETFYQNPDQIFTINWPTFDEIQGGGHFARHVDL